jgi:hypothetical protein
VSLLRLSPFLILSLDFRFSRRGWIFPSLIGISVLVFPSAQQGDNAVHYGYGNDNDSDEWSICVFHMANFWGMAIYFWASIYSVNEGGTADSMWVSGGIFGGPDEYGGVRTNVNLQF